MLDAMYSGDLVHIIKAARMQMLEVISFHAFGSRLDELIWIANVCIIQAFS